MIPVAIGFLVLTITILALFATIHEVRPTIIPLPEPVALPTDDELNTAKVGYYADLIKEYEQDNFTQQTIITELTNENEELKMRLASLMNETIASFDDDVSFSMTAEEYFNSIDELDEDSLVDWRNINWVDDIKSSIEGFDDDFLTPDETFFGTGGDIYSDSEGNLYLLEDLTYIGNIYE